MYRTVTDSSRLKKLLEMIAMAVFLDSLDGSIVNIARPTIAEGFSVDLSTAGWVIMAYFLFLVGLVPLFGKIADHGRLREVFCAGFVEQPIVTENTPRAGQRTGAVFRDRIVSCISVKRSADRRGREEIGDVAVAGNGRDPDTVVLLHTYMNIEILLY